MTGFWQNITEAQATIIAAFLTIIAALLGVTLGARLFGHRVKNFESAIEATETALEEHVDKIQDQLAELQRSVATTVEGIGQLRGDVGDIQNPAEAAAEKSGNSVPWDALKSDWNAIRDELERRAADPEIDGRTRAKYGRLDRRKYAELIDWLEYDGNLDDDSKYFYAANEIWQQFKNGRKIPDPAALQAMSNYKMKLVQRIG